MKVLALNDKVIFPESILEAKKVHMDSKSMLYDGVPIHQIETRKLNKIFEDIVYYADKKILDHLPEVEVVLVEPKDVYDKYALPEYYLALCCNKCHGVMFLDYTGATKEEALIFIQKAEFGECKAGGWHVEVGSYHDHTDVFEIH
jgi:hypothetical protein